MTKDLLSKAKSFKHERRNQMFMVHDPDEMVKVALAWANDEVTFTQINHLLGGRSASNAYCFLARAFKYYIRKNKK